MSLSDFDLVEASPDMLKLLSRRAFPGTIVPEITESMIEITTGVHSRHDELRAQLRCIRDALVAARLNSVFAFPLSGRAPFLLRWDDFGHDYFAQMERTGVVKSMKDFYWDIRPKPEYGTIELRVCDTPLTVDRAAPSTVPAAAP